VKASYQLAKDLRAYALKTMEMKKEPSAAKHNTSATPTGITRTVKLLAIP